MAPTRVPPHDLLAERSLLGSALMDAEILDVVAALVEARDFYAEAHQDIWQAMLAISVAGRPVDTLTLRDELVKTKKLNAVGGDEYLLSLTNTIPTVKNAETHALMIVEHASVRRVARVAAQIHADSYEPIEKVADFLDTAEAMIYEACATRENAKTGSLLPEVVAEVHRDLHRARDNNQELLGVPTGFNKLDRITTGYHPGDLIIVAGRPGMGKSAVAYTKLETAALTGRVVAGFSLEMPKKQWVVRAISNRARVDGNHVRTAQMSSVEWFKVDGAAEDLQRLNNFHIDDGANLTVMGLRGKLRRIRKQHGRLDLVVIDYLQLMRATQRMGSREQEVSEISGGLKKLAKEMEIPIIALAQLNRDIEKRSGKDKRPQLADLRESGAIEQDADTVLLVHRPEVYEPGNVDLEGIAEIIVAKQRSGATGVVRTKFFKSFTRFENLDEFEQEEMFP